MKKLMLCLALLAATFVASAQVASVSGSETVSFKVPVVHVNLDSVRPLLYWEVAEDSSKLEVVLSGILLEGGVKMQIYGELVDSFFRPKLAWLDGYSGRFPDDFFAGNFSSESHVNISVACGNAKFQKFFSNVLFGAMQKDNSRVVKRKIFQNPDDKDEFFTYHYVIRENGKFFFPQAAGSLTLK